MRERRTRKVRRSFVRRSRTVVACLTFVKWGIRIPPRRVGNGERYSVPYIIGLTGNIGTGKTTVLQMLARLGADVIDADALAHQVIAQGTPGWQAVIDAFGPDILQPDGEIDRARLGQIVFRDPAALKRLEAIVHPAVGVEIERRIRESRAPVVVIEAIKLIEAGMHTRGDALWVVTAEPEQQVQRLVAQRELSEAEARQRMAAQPPASAKVALADTVIDNSGTPEETWAQVQRAWDQIMARIQVGEMDGDSAKFHRAAP